MLKCIEIPIKEGISVLISISNPKVDVKTKQSFTHFPNRVKSFILKRWWGCIYISVCASLDVHYFRKVTVLFCGDKPKSH